MDTDNTSNPGPSSSQPLNSEVGVPSFPTEALNFHVQPQSLSHGYEAIYVPYEYRGRSLKMGVHGKFKLKKYLEKDYKKCFDVRRLKQAASMNDEAAVLSLLISGVDPSCYDCHRRTPLHIASCKGYVNIVRLLLEHGANPNARDLIGNTPLHLAACTNNIDVVLLLLRAGTDACGSDSLGRSPLQLAQSKLKILQKAKYPDDEIKKQVSMVIEMLLHFSKNSKRSNDVEALDLELLSTFQNSFKLSENRQDIDAQLSDLLNTLTIKTT